MKEQKEYEKRRKVAGSKGQTFTGCPRISTLFFHGV